MKLTNSFSLIASEDSDSWFSCQRFRKAFRIASIQDLIKNADKLANMSKDEVERILHGSGKYSLSPYYDRLEFVRSFSWSIPCKEAMDAFKKWARPPLYDVMAGSGFWTKILNQAGIKTRAFDLNPARKYNEYKHHSKHYKVERKHALETGRSIQRARQRGIHGDIILAWPPYESPVAHDLLKMLEVGSRIFYFGESAGGCTGDAAMHSFIGKNCKQLDYVYLPKFEGIHDSLIVYEKIKNDDVDANLRGVFQKKYEDYDDEDDEIEENPTASRKNKLLKRLLNA